jgi:hypothetical protein
MEFLLGVCLCYPSRMERDIVSLVAPDRVRRAVYTDAAPARVGG